MLTFRRGLRRQGGRELLFQKCWGRVHWEGIQRRLAKAVPRGTLAPLIDHEKIMLQRKPRLKPLLRIETQHLLNELQEGLKPSVFFCVPA